MSAMLIGLDWTAVAARLESAPAQTRARVLDLLEGVEAGAVKAAAQAARERGGDHG